MNHGDYRWPKPDYSVPASKTKGPALEPLLDPDPREAAGQRTADTILHNLNQQKTNHQDDGDENKACDDPNQLLHPRSPEPTKCIGMLGNPD